MKECLSNRIKISLNPLKGFLMVILLITIQCNTALSQNKVNFGLFASSVPNKIEVVIKPTYNESGSRYLTNMQFAVKWPVSSGITALVSSPSVPPFNLSAQGLPMSYNGYYYQVFTSIGGNSISWSANQEIVTQTLTYSGLPPFPFFEIAHDNYVKDIINGDYYFEVNGNQTLTGILYSDDAFLPYTWNGSQSSLWTNSANWTPQGIPNDTSSVYIPAATSVHNSPVLSTFTEIKNLKIYSSGRLTLANTGKLTVRNNLENNSDTGIIIKSTATETGSLITLGTMSGNGKAKVELSLTQASGGGVCYHYISSPIANAVMNLFSGYYMYYLKENTNSWVNMTIDSTMKLMNGYAIYKPSMVSDTRTFFGEINNGIIGSSNNVTRADENHGWNLMGNPYPSPIDWDASLGWTKTNVSEAIYFWKEVSKSYAAYVSGIGINGGNNIIPSMQAFMVRVDEGQSFGTLQMNNSVRVHDAQPFWKKSLQNVLRLTASNEDFSDETIIRFNPESSIKYDAKWDANKLMAEDAIAQLYTSAGNENLSINTLPEINNNLIVPLSVKINKSGVYKITASELGSFDVGVFIYLEDITLHEITDLRTIPFYSFWGVENEAPDRFRVHFSTSPIINNIKNQETANIYSSDKTLYISTEQYAQGKVEVYNALGNQLFSSQLQNKCLSYFNLSNFASGCYFVKAIIRNKIISTKILIR